MTNMYNNAVNGIRFNGDSEELGKLQTQKMSNGLQIVLAGILIIVSVFLESAKKDFLEYDSNAREFMGVCEIVCILIAIVLLICCPIALYGISKSEQQMHSTYITLYPDRVEGMHFSQGSSMGRFFSVPYSEIIMAGYYQPGLGVQSKSIEIKTTRGTYTVLNIEQTANVIMMINEYIGGAVSSMGSQGRIIGTFKSSQNFETANQTKQDTDQGVYYCMQCGTQLDGDAKFCYKCGQKREL